MTRRLNREGISAQAIHGDKSQSSRQRALQNFKEWKIQVLVATDIAARGIDIVEMPCVVNYDMPSEPETYVHRIGRTGRAKRHGVAYTFVTDYPGMAISFCDEEEKSILRDVEMVIDKLLDIDYDNPYPLGSYTPDPNQPAPARQGGRGRSGARRQEKPREQGRERAKAAQSPAEWRTNAFT